MVAGGIEADSRGIGNGDTGFYSCGGEEATTEVVWELTSRWSVRGSSVRAVLRPVGNPAARPDTEAVGGGKVSLRDGLDGASDTSGSSRGDASLHARQSEATRRRGLARDRAVTQAATRDGAWPLGLMAGVTGEADTSRLDSLMMGDASRWHVQAVMDAAQHGWRAFPGEDVVPGDAMAWRDRSSAVRNGLAAARPSRVCGRCDT
ncbi:hypothetical protein E2562_031726 [Oryza meyeriana var. granulata]|uniref:Uncharacterized protein n=1 Tax=Oryza meyeriana var. granulata TaxID=110450 RepID=A0A6G1FEM9_9ORYZ|nr:hypothetical protein E2562_031726 [Oryza meyeriana var. granulata]